MDLGASENGTGGAFLVAQVDGSGRANLGIVHTAGEANDLLAIAAAAATPGRWLVLLPSPRPAALDADGQNPETAGGAVASSEVAVTIPPPLVAALSEADDNTALVVAAAEHTAQAGSDTDSIRRLAAWLRRRSSSIACDVGPAIAFRPDEVVAVGGFDSTGTGLGVAELVTRLRAGGYHVAGAPTDPLALQDLEPRRGLRDRISSAVDWYRRNGTGNDIDRFRRRVVVAAALARTDLRVRPPSGAQTRAASEADAVLADVLKDARQSWPGPRPDEAQHGVGQRADWRFLLPDRPVSHLLLAGEIEGDPSDPPHFLEADRWASQVSRGAADTTGRPAADVVVITLDAAVDDALANTDPICTAVVELDRNPIGRLRRTRALQAAGFQQAAQYLVTPDLERAKRYVSLDQPEAIGWLLAPPPPVSGTATGVRRHAHRLLVSTVSRAVATAASLPIVSALAGAGTQGLIIATRGITVDPPAVLMTSGHDEGSRAVLVSLQAGGSDRTVTKMSPRPRYNQNTTAETEVIQAVRSMIDQSEQQMAATLLPAIKPSVEAGGLLGAQESYAGRWTATDLCNRVPDSRQPVLVQVLGAIDDFSSATVSTVEPWTEGLFENYLRDLFDRYHRLVDQSPAMAELQAELSSRSAELIGTPIPLVQRHYDLGPWNVVFADDASGLTIIDWELAPPRTLGQAGLAGADQLYFVKYWLHIALETASLDDEQLAFEFLPGEPQAAAARAFTDSLARLGVDRRFVPLLAGHLWLETALYTATRRAEHGGDPGSAARYLETLAARRTELLQFWS